MQESYFDQQYWNGRLLVFPTAPQNLMQESSMSKGSSRHDARTIEVARPACWIHWSMIVPPCVNLCKPGLCFCCTPSTPLPPKTKCAAAGVASLTEFGGVPEDHSLVKTPRYFLLHSSQTQTNQDVLPD